MARMVRGPNGRARHYKPISAAPLQLTHVRLDRKATSISLLVVIGVREDGRRLFTFAGLPPSQWRSARTTNAIERLHEEFKRRIKTQTVLPSADTAAMLFWALLASGQINMRKVDGWQTLETSTKQTLSSTISQTVDLAA